MDDLSKKRAIDLSGEELAKIFIAKLSEMLPYLKMENIEKTRESYLSVQEVKDRYGISASTLWRWNKNGYLKQRKCGNKVYYKEEEIINRIEESVID